MTDAPAATRAVPTGPSHHRAAAAHGHEPHSVKELTWLSLGALGVVYGDIGTSPLYAMREAFTPNPERGTLAPNADAVFGITSLFFWALVLVVHGGRPRSMRARRPDMPRPSVPRAQLCCASVPSRGPISRSTTGLSKTCMPHMPC